MKKLQNRKNIYLAARKRMAEKLKKFLFAVKTNFMKKNLKQLKKK